MNDVEAVGHHEPRSDVEVLGTVSSYRIGSSPSEDRQAVRDYLV